MIILWTLIASLFAEPLPSSNAGSSKRMSADQAEITRLREKMNQYQQSGALEYSEKMYLQMVELDPRSKWMKDSDHLAGAMASNAKGDLLETLKRLERCTESERALQWRRFLLEETGPVRIEKSANAELNIMMGLMNPDQIAAIAYANEQLQQGKVFQGRLPNGAYQYGSQQFLVSAMGLTTANGATLQQSNTPDVSSNAVSGQSFWDIVDGEIGVGISSDVSIWHLSEGIILENQQTLSPKTQVSFGIRPQLRLNGSVTSVRGEVGLRQIAGRTFRARVWEPGLHLEYYWPKMFVALGSNLTVGRLEFDEAEYIKRSLGYSFVTSTGYKLIDNMYLTGRLEGGVLGSHNMWALGLGVAYHL